MAESAYAGIGEDLASFFKGFYAYSDNQSGTAERYADDFFLPDATMTLASKTVKGRDDIVDLRKTMLSSVKSRKHTVYMVFQHPISELEFMLRGKVEQLGLDDVNRSREWAGWARFDLAGTKLKFAEYHIYLDTGAQK